MSDGFNELKVVQLTEKQVRELRPDDVVYIDNVDFDREEDGLVLTEARITDASAEGGFFPYRTVFGEDGQVRVEDGIYAEAEGADTGEVTNVVQRAGTYLRLALFQPGGDEELFGVIAEALRKKYGEGVIEVWEEVTRPVADVHVDVYAVKTGRGRKPADDTRELHKNVLKAYVPHVEVPEGYRVETRPHEPTTRKVRTI